jgi:hypothetical protein
METLYSFLFIILASLGRDNSFPKWITASVPWIYFSPNLIINLIYEGDVMAEACNMYVKDNKCTQNFSRKFWREDTACEI